MDPLETPTVSCPLAIASYAIANLGLLRREVAPVISSELMLES
jgi:hypothetical protein